MSGGSARLGCSTTNDCTRIGSVIALDARIRAEPELQSVHCRALRAGPVAREGDALYVGLSDADAGALISGTCEGYSIQDVGKLDVEPPEWLADQERLPSGAWETRIH